MCEMSNCHLVLFLDSGEERTFVVDFKSEDAMLVGCCKGCGVCGAVDAGGCGLKWKPYERREHAEFELQGV